MNKFLTKMNKNASRECEKIVRKWCLTECLTKEMSAKL